jgi:hypothetical protein
MATVMLWFLVVCVALVCLAAVLAGGAWSMAVVMLGHAAPAVLMLTLTARTRIVVPAARVVVRHRLKGGSL